MLHEFTILVDGEEYRFETPHTIDAQCRQVFEDMVSHRSITHCDPVDLENFLATKGNLVSECIEHIQLGETEAIAALLVSEKFTNIKKMLVCVYSHIDMDVDHLDKIVACMWNDSVLAETGFMLGWIGDEQADKNSVTVHLIAICSESTP